MKKSVLLTSVIMLLPLIINESWAVCNGATATTAGTDEDGAYCGTWDCGADGSSVTCTLSKGTLTISGNGDMKDYTWEETRTVYPRRYTSSAPWAGSMLTKAIVEGDVTRIGAASFLGETYFTEISGMNNITSIGRSAFEKTGLTSIDISNVDEIDQGVFFDDTNLRYIYMKNSVIVLAGWDAFSDVPVKNFCTLNEQTGLKTCGTCDGYIKSGTGCVKAENCGVGFVANETTKTCVCAKEKVEWKGKCLYEYPFAKKRWTPAEAGKWLHDGNDNFVIITFKK